MKLLNSFLIVGFLATLTVVGLVGPDLSSREFSSWTLQEAASLLSESPWAKKETFTRVVGGIGSGVQGEKEIYSTYFVRFLSAEPIRKAFARIEQIHLGYEEMSENERRSLDRRLQGSLDLDLSDWIVISVAFRSNNPREQASMKRFFDNQTTETMRRRAYLSSETFPRVELATYYPAVDESVGSKFVFPRQVDGRPIVEPSHREVVFEFDTPGGGRQLRAIFDVHRMMVEGKLCL